MRWLCWGLLATLLTFVFVLFRVQLTGSVLKPVNVIRPEPPKPPAWEAFPFLQRYYGGIRTLVPREANVPEYPQDEDEHDEPEKGPDDENKDDENKEENKEEGKEEGKEEKKEKDEEKKEEKNKEKKVARDEDGDDKKDEEKKDEEKKDEGKKDEGKKDEKEKDEKDKVTGDGEGDDTKNLTLTASSSPFNPYPNYKSKEYIAKYGTKVDCYLDENATVRIPQVHRYNGVPKGFPDAAMGSNEVVGINDTVCFERFGRLGPYGLGYGKKSGGSGAGLEADRDGIENVWEDVPPVDFRDVKWADAQKRCIAANRHRFPTTPTPQLDRFHLPIGGLEQQEKDYTTAADKAAPANATSGSQRLSRTAVMVRTWHDYKYDDEAILYLRSLVSELSLVSGGEYEVYFLVHVKDDNLQIWSNDETYDRVLNDSLPEEFRGMGVLWSERQMGLVYGGIEESWYRNLPVHGVYRSTFMPMQYFASQHPEYDYFWNWEMDLRYTGHWYHFFDKVISWARAQPRKGLWERNSRFYVPSVHGSWEDFRQMVRVQTEMGTNNPNNLMSNNPLSGKNNNDNEKKKDQNAQGDKPIWGPERPPVEEDVLKVDGEGVPPTSYEKDKHQWGVDEDADLIVFNPLYDPEGTTWLLRDDFTGYHKKSGAGKPPRRAAIITASRLSRKLLHTMHHETSQKRHHMFSEMWPASTALQHGFKAVFVPHSVYIDRRWPTTYLESVFNAGRNGATGGARTSIFGEPEHNFRGTTWFYSAGHSGVLWRRWLGYLANNDGGEEFELQGEGRMCLPPMMMHPIKEVEMIVDSADEQEQQEQQEKKPEE